MSAADPIMAVVRRSLDDGPKTVAAVAEALRLDAVTGCDFDSAVDSLAVAVTCMAELGCRPLPKKNGADTETLWATPRYINLTTPSGMDAYAQ